MSFLTEFGDIMSDGMDLLFEDLGIQQDVYRFHVRYVNCEFQPEPVEIIDIPERVTEEVMADDRRAVRIGTVLIRPVCGGCQLALTPDIDAQLDMNGEIWAIQGVEAKTENVLRLTITRPVVKGVHFRDSHAIGV